MPGDQTEEMLLLALLFCLLGRLSRCSQQKQDDDLALTIDEVQRAWHRADHEIMLYGRLPGSPGPFLRLVDDYAESFIRNLGSEDEGLVLSGKKKGTGRVKASRFLFPTDLGQDLELLFVKRSHLPTGRINDDIKELTASKTPLVHFNLGLGLAVFLDHVLDRLVSDELCVCILARLSSTTGFTLLAHTPVASTDTGSGSVLSDPLDPLAGSLVVYQLGSPVAGTCSHEFQASRTTTLRRSTRITTLEHLDVHLTFCKSFGVDPVLRLAHTEDHQRLTSEDGGSHYLDLFHPGRSPLALKFLFSVILDGTLQTVLKAEVSSIYFDGFLPGSLKDACLALRFSQELSLEAATMLHELLYGPARLGFLKALQFGCVNAHCDGACCCSRLKAMQLTAKRPVFMRLLKGELQSRPGPLHMEEAMQVGEAGAFSQSAKYTEGAIIL